MQKTDNPNKKLESVIKDSDLYTPLALVFNECF